MLHAQKRWEEAIPEYEAALELNHNLQYALTGLGWCKLYTGSIEQVTQLVEQAIRLSPRDCSLHGHLLLCLADPQPGPVRRAVQGALRA